MYWLIQWSVVYRISFTVSTWAGTIRSKAARYSITVTLTNLIRDTPQPVKLPLVPIDIRGEGRREDLVKLAVVHDRFRCVLSSYAYRRTSLVTRPVPLVN